MKKRLISWALLSAMLAGLAGCGQTSTDQDAANSDASQSGGSDDVITVAMWDSPQEPGFTEILAKFTEETGIETRIEVTPWDQYWTMLEAAATGGSMPDVFIMHSNEIAKYAENDMLLDLTDYIEQSDKIDMTKYPEDIVNLYQNEDGAQLGIPKDIDIAESEGAAVPHAILAGGLGLHHQRPCPDMPGWSGQHLCYGSGAGRCGVYYP